MRNYGNTLTNLVLRVNLKKMKYTNLELDKWSFGDKLIRVLIFP